MTEETKAKITRISFYALTVLVLLRFFFGIPDSLAWYALISATVTGFTTYLGIISFNIDKKPFFIKWNLVPFFVAFCFTAPLVELPDIVRSFIDIPKRGAGEFGISGKIALSLTVCGQIFWLLIPLQAALSLFGDHWIFRMLGLCVLALGLSNMIGGGILLILFGPALEILFGQ